MLTYRVVESVIKCRKCLLLLLAFFTFFGSLFGVIVAYRADPFAIHLMRLAICSSVSIVDLLFVILIPFLFTAIAAYFAKPIVFVLLSFLKTFCFSLCCALIYRIYGSASWIVSAIFLLPDSVVLLLLYVYWVRQLRGD